MNKMDKIREALRERIASQRDKVTTDLGELIEKSGGFGVSDYIDVVTESFSFESLHGSELVINDVKNLPDIERFDISAVLSGYFSEAPPEICPTSNLYARENPEDSSGFFYKIALCHN